MRKLLRYGALLLITCGLMVLMTAIGQSAPVLQASASAPTQATQQRSLTALIDQGIEHFHQGEFDSALASWQAAEQHYREQADRTGILLSQINQVQALRSLGYYVRAQQLVAQIQQSLLTQPDSVLKAQALQTVGIAFRDLGELEAAEAVLAESLAIARQLNDIEAIAQSHFQLGNTAQANDNLEAAQTAYQQALEIAEPNSRIWLETALNQSRLLVNQQKWTAATPLLEIVRSRLLAFPPSRWRLYAQINLAETLLLDIPPAYSPPLRPLLTNTLQQSRTLGDLRGESYALGQLGRAYEKRQQWSEALASTNQALQKAQQAQADEIVASWQWQKGRILKAQGAVEDAIAAYSQSVVILESLDQDLVSLDSAAQFSFQQRVEPVYRQLVALLLQDVDNLPAQQQQQRLIKSRDTVESLQLAELENFFREACLTYAPRPIDQIDSQAAVIYPIVLGDRLEVILSLPNQPLAHYGNPLPDQLGTTTFQALRQSLNPAFPAAEVLPPAQQLYDWLIRPAEAALTEQKIESLVFVPDSYLRSVPMAVLHDGTQFLIEKYGIALTPGLQLFESSKLTNQPLKVLAGGLTDARQGFSALPAVDTEVAQIKAQFPAEILLNSDFTSSKLTQEIEEIPFSIVHLATHGQFSSKAEDTFILTWNDRLQIKALERLLQQRELQTPIELLVLSACQTAKGDERAALGMAGIAVRSGARSTIASLWSVQDRSTAELMSQFYQAFRQPQLSRAEALRRSQLSLLHSTNYTHPYYWAPFVLIGNWL
ncbi:CHAT domain-containing protein [cf. Phormidesmis sp. LEGE 11477]|uniref:CHAT domain-containing protein n=1 Tax=cf. Phormidesmis sp. LEGE 11477 TaxID=1828680 RepID=UPI00187E0797|nr:CHAT domain-containing protein [cf. Phormidesmis sp. LEGE 11477]MBE9064072.1 CHAT domain-containing protein [cf. Phormidesmis sp. LEGE 11477]